MTAIVEVNNLTKRFSEEVLAVDNISFSVEEGESSVSSDLTVRERALRSICSPPF